MVIGTFHAFAVVSGTPVESGLPASGGEDIRTGDARPDETEREGESRSSCVPHTGAAEIDALTVATGGGVHRVAVPICVSRAEGRKDAVAATVHAEMETEIAMDGGRIVAVRAPRHGTVVAAEERTLRHRALRRPHRHRSLRLHRGESGRSADRDSGVRRGPFARDTAVHA